MARIFISYRRSDTRHITGRVYDRLVAHYGKENIFRDIDKKTLGIDFRHKLRTAVANCDVLLAIIGDKWESVTDENGNRRLDNPDDFVRIEIESALQRPDCLVVPILIDDAQMPKPNNVPADLRDLTFKDATYVRDSDFHADMNELIQHLDDYFNPLQPEPASMIESRVKIAPKTGVMLGAMMVVLVIMGLAIVALNGINQLNMSASNPTNTVESVIVVMGEPTEKATSSEEVSPTTTLSYFAMQLLLESTQTSEAMTNPAPTSTITPTEEVTSTEEVIASATLNEFVMQLFSTQTAAAHPISVPSQTPTLSPEQLALTPMARNEDWIPYERDFDGVTMVLVPAGCFMMGSETGRLDEQPVHQQCFDKPFWVDKYEVTQGQFAQFGGVKANANRFTRDDFPIEQITWIEASDYCENNRDSRLPTEPEWEYVARGPNSLLYPWGNDFVEDNVVYYGNENNVAPVGTRDGGISWVGAIDMVGNVWEWVGSWYGFYPYNNTYEDSNRTGLRVFRGGSCCFFNDIPRSTLRNSLQSTTLGNNIGFRCARDYVG